MAADQQRVWLITGATSGFGRAIAEAAVAAGDAVVAAARRPDAVADLVESAPDRVTALQLDVTDHDRIVAAVGEVLDRYGRVGRASSPRTGLCARPRHDAARA